MFMKQVPCLVTAKTIANGCTKHIFACNLRQIRFLYLPSRKKKHLNNSRTIEVPLHEFPFLIKPGNNILATPPGLPA